jgi:Mg/Co/Ni transporter MgtE
MNCWQNFNEYKGMFEMEQVHTELPEQNETEEKARRQSSMFYAIILDKDSTYDCTVSAKNKKELSEAISKLMVIDEHRKICGIFQGKSIAHRPVTKIELI